MLTRKEVVIARAIFEYCMNQDCNMWVDVFFQPECIIDECRVGNLEDACQSLSCNSNI